MMTKSILQEKKECLICRTTGVLHQHHVFEGVGRRKISDREGLTVWLCPHHHNMSNNSVHYNKLMDLKIKKWAEQKWLDHNKKTIEDFIKVIGKNYL